MRASDPETTPDQIAGDAVEERVAIRECCSGQDRAEAERPALPEARCAAGNEALDDWRARADDVISSDNWL